MFAIVDRWTPSPRQTAIAFALGLSGLGLLSLVFRDFALTWEPVPDGLAGRAALAMASGAVLLAVATLTAWRRTRSLGAAGAAAVFGVWVLLHLPAVAKQPLSIAAWLGVAESAGMAAGAFLLHRLSQPAAAQAGGPARIAIMAFGVACLVYGASHFAYAAFTAGMIPPWLPLRLPLAYATGAVHALAGVGILFTPWRRLAALVEGLMMGVFVLLVHVPRVAAHASSQLELTMLCVAVILSAAAFTVAAACPPLDRRSAQ